MKTYKIKIKNKKSQITTNNNSKNKINHRLNNSNNKMIKNKTKNLK